MAGSITSPLAFLHMLERLKNTPRSGWVRRGIHSPESVSDHMYRMAVMCLLFMERDTKVDVMKCVMIALVHDVGEAIIGDITPFDGISTEQKYLRERLAVKYLSCLLKPSNPTLAEKMMELWLEFEDGRTPESQLVGQLDDMECLIQAKEYEEQTGKRLVDDFIDVESRITLPELEGWKKALLTERDVFWSRNDRADVVIFVLGGPGVGKGTQCARLAQEFGFQHISAGELLRNEAQSSTSVYAEFIKDSMRHSVIVPAQLTIDLLKKRINNAFIEGTRIFLLDGFPRSMDQALEFEKIHTGNYTLFLDCPEEVMLLRLQKRAESSGRIDDNPDTVKRRLQVFRSLNAPVEAHLKQTGLFRTVECGGTEDEVYSDHVKPAVEDILGQTKRGQNSVR